MSNGIIVGNNIARQFEARLDAAGIHWAHWSEDKHNTEYEINDACFDSAMKILVEIRRMKR